MNPYHDEKGRFTSAGAAGQNARMTMEGDKVKIATMYGGGSGVIKGFSPSGEYAIVESKNTANRGAQNQGTGYFHMSNLKVTMRGDAGRVADVMKGLTPIGHPIKISGR